MADNSQDGYWCWNQPMVASDGNFYGVTTWGGYNAAGSIYQMTPDGTYTTLVAFSNYGVTGANPVANIIQGNDGAFYGTNLNIGPYLAGTIFRYDAGLPWITRISPTSLDAGASNFTLTVKGYHFSSASSVTWNGNTLATAYVSPNELKATVPASQITSAGTAYVSTSTTGIGSSNVKDFTLLVTTLKLASANLTR